MRRVNIDKNKFNGGISSSKHMVFSSRDLESQGYHYTFNFVDKNR